MARPFSLVIASTLTIGCFLVNKSVCRLEIYWIYCCVTQVYWAYFQLAQPIFTFLGLHFTSPSLLRDLSPKYFSGELSRNHLQISLLSPLSSPLYLSLVMCSSSSALECLPFSAKYYHTLYYHLLYIQVNNITMKTFFALASLCASASAFAPAANSAVESEYMFLFKPSIWVWSMEMSMTSARGAEKPSGELSLMKCVFSAGVIHHCNRPIIGCFLHKLCIQIQQQASNSLSSFAGVLYCQTPTRLPIQYQW